MELLSDAQRHAADADRHWRESVARTGSSSKIPLRAVLDLDPVSDAEHSGHARRGVFGGGPLSAVAHRAGQDDIALTRGRPVTIGHVVRRERTIHPLCQGSVL